MPLKFSYPNLLTLTVGTKVGYSELGKKMLRPRKPDRTGVITGKAKIRNCVSVIWDDKNISRAIHKDYIQPINKEVHNG